MLDIRQFEQQQTHGDITSYLTYQGGKRLLVLKSNKRTGRPVAFPEEYAHMYAQIDGYASEYLCSMASVYAVQLGYEETDYSAPLKIIDIVLDRMQDLVRLAPVEEKPIVDGVEYEVKLAGQTVAQGVK